MRMTAKGRWVGELVNGAWLDEQVNGEWVNKPAWVRHVHDGQEKTSQ